MILFTHFLNKIAALLILGLLLFPSLADAEEIKKENPAVHEERIRIAVFPVENLSGTVAPVKEIRQAFIKLGI
jgi:hypothetical protein